MQCPSCPAQPLALFVCDDGVHRCYQCKTRRPMTKQFPLQPARPAKAANTPKPTPPKPTEHETILKSKVAIRNRLAKIEGVSGWDKSAWNCGKHEGLSEALQILKEAAE